MGKVLLAVVLLASACTQNPDNPPGGGGSGGGGGAGGGGGGGIVLGPDDVLLEMTPFLVKSTEEHFKCQNFANPFGGERVEVQEWESHMAQGSHHLLVFYENGASNGPLEDCPGLEFAKGPYGAQTPDAKITYPPGIASVIEGNQGLRFASHYLNVSQQDVMASVKLIIRRAKPGSVQHRASVFFFNNTNILLGMSDAEQPLTKTCTVPRDVYFLFSTGHMHKRGRSLTATVNGKTIYRTTSWDFAPFTQHTPPLFLAAGTDVTFTCMVRNIDVPLLTFGESAERNEMCIFDGQFYPDPSGNGLNCL
jgi:hypothetical protein